MGKADSGAIIVGAGLNCNGDVLRSRQMDSNYGKRINLQGPGNCVTTAGYGDLNGAGSSSSYYTQYFNSTSAATPVVAAAAASLSSSYKTLNNVALTPVQVRTILMQNATAQNTGTGALPGNIGPMPDLAKALLKADITKPGAPTGLTVKLNSSKKPVLSWKAPTDNVKVASYRIYRNGSLYKTTTALTYTDTSVNRRTTYRYQIAAVDTSGNVSPLSASVSIKTPR
jgi:hypothetical protein